MVAALSALLSDHPPDAPRRAGLGDRFYYFRGRSGRRYLFTVIPKTDLADFHSAVAVVARRTGEGRVAAPSVTVLDAAGRPAYPGNWPPIVPHGAMVLVHLLADTDAERDEIVADLTSDALPLVA